MIFNKYRLEDITDKIGDGIHGTPEYDDNGDYYFVNGNNLVDGDIVLKKDTKRINEEQYLKNKRDLNKNTLLVSINGTLGNVATYNNEKIILGKSACYINVKDDYNVDYVYFVFESPEFKKYLQYGANGTTIKNVPLSAIRNYEISIPSKENQDKIVKILKSIEDKIKLNNKINNNLLQLCRYKYDELNKKYDEWDLVKINDLNLEATDYVANGSFKSLADNVTLYDDKEYALYVRNTDLKVNFTDKRKYVDQKSYEFLKKSKLKGGELIISNVGDVGSVFICPHLNMPMTLGSNVIMLYETDSHYYNYFLYFFFTSVYGQYMIGGITGGSAQPKFNKTDFRNMEIKFPAFGELDKFNAEIDPIYKKYELNIKENEKLSELRDTLLPKLMNGEIDLDNIEL